MTFENAKGETVDFKIAGIVDNFEPYISSFARIDVLLSNEDLAKEEEIISNSEIPMIPVNFDIRIDTDYPQKIDEELARINELRKNDGKQTIYGTNTYEYTNSNKISELSKRAIIQIPLYAFVRINFAI